MRGFSLIEVLVSLSILSLCLYLILPPHNASIDKEAVYQALVRARWSSTFRGEKVKIKCEGKQILFVERLPLHHCSASCNSITFHPSGYVTPSGSLILKCEGKSWKFVVSALGRIRILEFRSK